MAFFLMTLLLSLILSLILFLLLVHSLKINWERKNRLALGYLMPVLLTGAFTLLTLSLTVPCLLDSVYLYSQTYEIEEVVINQDAIHWNSLSIGDQRFFFNQWHFVPLAGQRYRISYTPHSRYIVDMQAVAETPETPTAADDQSQAGEP